MVSAFGWLRKLLRCDQLSTASARLRTRPTKQRSHSCNSYNPRPVMNITTDDKDAAVQSKPDCEKETNQLALVLLDLCSWNDFEKRISTL